MNNLFDFSSGDKGYKVEVNPLLLSIIEFENIWNRDETIDKNIAKKEFTFIYGMCSSENDNIWKDYINEKDRQEIIINDVFGKDNDWTPDRMVLNAINKYKERYPKEPAELLLDTLKEAMIKIKDHISGIDYNERDNNGRLIYNPKDVLLLSREATKTYMEIEEIIDKIRSNKRLKIDRLKGGVEESSFETASSLNGLI